MGMWRPVAGAKSWKNSPWRPTWWIQDCACRSVLPAALVQKDFTYEAFGGEGLPESSIPCMMDSTWKVMWSLI